jgi:hypothetical protein
MFYRDPDRLRIIFCLFNFRIGDAVKYAGCGAKRAWDLRGPDFGNQYGEFVTDHYTPEASAWQQRTGLGYQTNRKSQNSMALAFSVFLFILPRSTPRSMLVRLSAVF